MVLPAATAPLQIQLGEKECEAEKWIRKAVSRLGQLHRHIRKPSQGGTSFEPGLGPEPPWQSAAGSGADEAQEPKLADGSSKPSEF